MIGGTSTGAIIAACLAIGMSVKEIDTLYHKLARSVFKKSWLRYGILDAKFPTKPLQDALESVFKDICLGGDEIQTGLMVVTKRLDTGSPWVIHNHPESYFYDARKGSTPNKHYLLRQIVRASTAAPHYFEPERIQVAEGVSGAFVDGGVSPHNSPALQCFMLATLDGYGWKWPKGADNIVLVSLAPESQKPV